MLNPKCNGIHMTIIEIRPFRKGWQVHESARGLPIIGAFDNPRPAGINDLILDCDRTNSLALSRNLEPNVTQYLV